MSEWEAEYSGGLARIWSSSSGRYIACSDKEHGPLIAAAPDLKAALKRLYTIAIDVFHAEGEQYEAVRQAISALAAAGDADTIAAQTEWKQEMRRVGLPT
jgi:hypothetical protein